MRPERRDGVAESGKVRESVEEGFSGARQDEEDKHCVLPERKPGADIGDVGMFGVRGWFTRDGVRFGRSRRAREFEVCDADVELRAGFVHGGEDYAARCAVLRQVDTGRCIDGSGVAAVRGRAAR